MFRKFNITHLWLAIALFCFGAIALGMCSCEYETEPNLVVINAYFDGRLNITDMRSREQVVNELMLFNTEKDLFLEIGTYQVRLIVDQGVDPLMQDRWMIVDITDIYSHNKIVFKP